MDGIMDGFQHLLQGPDTSTPRMSWEWGTVTDELRVLQEGDLTPLPANVTTLTPLVPGLRVVVFRYGQSLIVMGAARQPITLEPGASADVYTTPGSFVLSDGFFATPEFGFPDSGSAGWLDVDGNQDMVIQRFTSAETLEVFTRVFSRGSWSAWSGADTFTPLTLSAPWVKYGTTAAWGTPSYRVRGPRVELAGMVTGGTGTSSQPIAVLPENARPSVSRIFSIPVNDVMELGQVNPSGELYLRKEVGNGWASLSDVSFPK